METNNKKSPGPLRPGLESLSNATALSKGHQTSRQVRLLPVRIRTFRPAEQRLFCFAPLGKGQTPESGLRRI